MYVEANAKDYIEHMSIEVSSPVEPTPNGINTPMKSLNISGDDFDKVCPF